MLGVSVPAMAQSRVVPVAERIAGDHAAIGMRKGAFLVIPRVDLEESIRDNIYVMPGPRRHDRVTTVRPEVAVKSNWSRHAVNLLAKAELNRFAVHDSENTNNYKLAIDGRVDVRHETSVGGGLAWRRDHEDRGDPETPASVASPQEYDTTTAKLGAYRGLGRLRARLDSEVRRLAYKDTFTTSGLPVDASLRNRTEYRQSLWLGYRLTPQFELFGKGSMDNRVYDTKAPVNRSSRGQVYVLGGTFDITGKTHADVYGGLLRRHYTQPGTPDLAAPTFGAKLTWNPGGMTTVLARVDRTVEETTLGASSGYIATRYALGLQHALTRRLVAHADMEADTNHYRGTAPNQRRDTVWTASLGADCYLGRIWRLGLGYTYRNRDSNASGGGYRANTVLIRLSATY